MSQGLLEGRRENQQACSRERSRPEFSKPLLPTESWRRGGSRAASPAFWGLPACLLCWAALSLAVVWPVLMNYLAITLSVALTPPVHAEALADGR